MRPASWKATLLACLLASLLWTAAALPGTAPSGSPAGIALAQSVKQAYGKISIQSYVQHGFVWMAASEGRSSSFSWAFGEGPARGLYRATERGELALVHGKVVWWRDDLNPGACTLAGVCDRLPVEVLLDSRGLFYAFGNVSRHSCYAPLRGTAPVSIGKPVWSVYGDFQAPARSGADEKLTSTYPWFIRGAPPLMATEVDTVAATGARLLSARVTVSAKPGHQAAPFTYSASYSYPATTAPQPAATLCP